MTKFLIATIVIAVVEYLITGCFDGLCILPIFPVLLMLNRAGDRRDERIRNAKH